MGAVLSRIHISHPRNIWEVLNILEDLRVEERKFYKNIPLHLLIIDSFTNIILPLVRGSPIECKYFEY